MSQDIARGGHLSCAAVAEYPKVEVAPRSQLLPVD